MISFYFEARRTMDGRMVEFIVYNGRREGAKVQLGLLAFSQEEWLSFRPIVVGGMRAAGYARIPIEFMDQTHEAPPSLKSVH